MSDINENNILFNDISNHLLKDKKPSIYLRELLNNGSFDNYPFEMLKVLKDTKQNPVYHPEGSVWEHTMLVVDNAAIKKEESEEEAPFMWAALLHDIGKAPTTAIRKGKITSYNHDTVGGDLGEKFLDSLKVDEKFKEKVVALIRWHMQSLFVNKNLPYSDVKSMLRDVSLDEIGLLSYCDRMGRNIESEEDIRKVEESIKSFKASCRKISRS